jgi:nucleoside phosphorylase
LESDPQTYHELFWQTANTAKLRIVAAAPNQMGLAASGVLAAKMILKFRPRLVIMAGIAAGTKRGDQGFGDIVTPENTFDYGAGKSIDVGGAIETLSSPYPLPINAKLLGRLKQWQSTKENRDKIVRNWASRRPGTELLIHTGPMFSMPTVQQTSEVINKTLLQWRKLAAVEMEAHAVHRACNDTTDPAPLYLCAKSICDFAANKDDDWQHYAAYTSANFAKVFVESEWDTLIPPKG